MPDAPPLRPEFQSLRQSDIGLLLACGWKFYLHRGVGLPKPGSRRARMGTALHRGLENLYRALMMGDRVDPAEARAYALDTVAVGMRLAPRDEVGLEEGETLEAAIALDQLIVGTALDTYVERLYPDIAATGAPLAVEQTLELDYRGFRLSGTLDLVSGEGVIHDHKLTLGYAGEQVAPAHWVQLARYAWFVHEVLGVKVRAVQVDLVSAARMRTKKPRVDFRSYRDADVDTLLRVGRESVDQALDMIRAGTFPRNGLHAFASLCATCPYEGAACKAPRNVVVHLPDGAA